MPVRLIGTKWKDGALEFYVLATGVTVFKIGPDGINYVYYASASPSKSPSSSPSISPSSSPSLSPSISPSASPSASPS
jgi:hypothetical protein